MTYPIEHVIEGGAWLTVQELAAANKAIGKYWFSADTMRWFDPQEQLLFGGRYLVANEKDYDGSRIWRLAYADDQARIEYLPAPEWATYASLTYATYGDAAHAALALEAGKPPLEKLDYGGQVVCGYDLSANPRATTHYASWLVDGQPYCHQHTGNVLAASLDTSAGVKRKGGIHRGDLDGGRGGDTFDPALDTLRLNKQMRAVYSVVRGGDWWTLGAIAAATGSPEASVSARLRDFRKRQYGGHQVNRRRVHPPSGGHWQYQLVWNEAVPRPDIGGD